MISWTSPSANNRSLSTKAPQRACTLTATNQQANDPWGDVMAQKPEQCTRIYIQNVNGFSLDRRGGQFDHFCAVHKEIQADISCGQEHKLDTTQMQVLFDTTGQHWDRSKLLFGTSPIPFSSHYKPGGTFMLTTGSITGRVRKQHRDKWGRYVAQEFSGRQSSTLMIISAYQPVDQRAKEGTNSVVSQHHSLLLQSSDITTNPRVAFCRDLLQQLTSYCQAGTEFLLVGDFNESFGSDPDGMSLIASSLGLINIMSKQHPDLTAPVSYARGVKCLDYALGTPRVAAAVTAAGYDAFNARFISDHRGYFLDMDTKILFGSPTQDLVTNARRRLRSSNLKQNTAYIERLYELLDAHKVMERADRLTFAGNHHALAESLDRDVTAACLAAEAHLPLFGEAAWSPDLAIARKRTHALGKLFYGMKAGRDVFDTIEMARTIMPPTWCPPTTVLQSSQQWRNEKKRAAKIAATSIERRDKAMTERIRELEKSGATQDRETATIIRRLKKAEDLKRLWKKLKIARQADTHHREGVVRLEIPLHSDTDPKQYNDWQVIDVPSEVVAHLQKRNRTHFGQAHGTPFTVPPLSDQLGFTGDSIAATQILEGRYDSSPLSESVQLLIKHLKYTHEIEQDTCRPTINDADFCGKLKVWRESTSTSPSGLHLGHYKVLIARHSFSSDADETDLSPEFIARRNEINRKQNAIRYVRLALIDYALERGCSYRRWQTIINSVLFKDADNVCLHRTRIIHIYEADFNLAMGLKWRVASQQAEDLETLNQGQYGSRTGRSAVEPVYIEEMQCEISRATRKPLVLTNYDATACYDRIVPNLGMIASRKFSVAASVAKATAETLRTAEYRVRTELGISERGYQHTPDLPIYGTGQGSTFSGQTWNFLSSTLIDCYDTAATPAKYSNPTQSVEVTIGIAGFVDDCNGQTNQFDKDGSTATVAEVISQAQQNAQLWTNLLSASGGALEISKCSCHILQHKFSIQGAPFLVPSFPTDQVQISVWDPHESSKHDLNYCPCTRPTRPSATSKNQPEINKNNSASSKTKVTTRRRFYGLLPSLAPKHGLSTTRVS